MFLGLDGGGTKTESVLMDARGEVLGRGLGGPCNLITCSTQDLAESITQATQHALKEAGTTERREFEGVCVGVAGYTAASARARLQKILPELIPARRHRIEPDFVVGFWGASLGKPGLGLFAGTGSIVYGRSQDDREARVGGRGFLLNDEGSGYWMGAQALRRTLDRVDREESLANFDRRVLEWLGASDAEGIVHSVMRDFAPSRIAALARPLGEWAEAGDPVAQSILNEAADALAGLAKVAARKLSLDIASASIFQIGGLWNLQGGFAKSVERAWGYPLSRPARDAAYGAALLSKK